MLPSVCWIAGADAGSHNHLSTGGAANQIIVALDIGTTKICALVGDVDSAGVVQILGMGQSVSEGLRKGVVVDMDAATRNIQAAVDSAMDDAGVEIHSVVVGVTGEHVASVNNKSGLSILPAGREITSQDVERVLDGARAVAIPGGCEVIHVLPRGFVVDGQVGVRQPVGMCSSRLEVEVHIVVGSSSFLQNVFKSVQAAGLHVDAVVLEPIATSEAVLVEAEKELGTLVADIGGGTTDLAIVVDGYVAHTAVIPVGGNHVTNDLAYGLKTSRSEAEKLKISSGSVHSSGESADELLQVLTAAGEQTRPMTRRAMSDVIEARMHELFTLVRRELHSSGFEKTVSGVVLSGGGSQLQGATELCSQVLQLPVRIGRPRNVAGSVELTDPMYSTAVGLLYFGAARHYGAQRETAGHFLARALNQLRRWASRFLHR